MNEKLMQFIWQGRFMRNGPYYTIDGSLLEVFFPGTHNFNQGPDFLNARIKIGITEWAGNIELHVRASDWYKHRHEQDLNFRNIILHIVWINDQAIIDHLGKPIHCFCMQAYVSQILLERYQDLLVGNAFLKPCHSYLPAMKLLQWVSWKERLVLERLEKRSKKIIQWYQEARQDWETVTWWVLASNMGLKVNEALFESVARTISLKVLANHRNQIHQLESLLMGQANLLNLPFEESYPRLLQKEYAFLKKKYRLQQVSSQPAFLRMRPASFPSIRLAQLAAILQRTDHFFDFFKNAEKISIIKESLIIYPNDYWIYHYQFDRPGLYQQKQLGDSMANSILINTVIPMLYSYGKIMKENIFQEKALNWLLEINAEQNRYTKEWAGYQIANHTAFDSQALIELSNAYCKEKRCLECAVGNAILNTSITLKASPK